MFERLKRALVDSYVGAIALGYVLAQCILHFVNIFGSPVAAWVTRNEYRDVIPHTAPVPGFLLRDALPEFVRFSLLFVVWYVLVRWLYFTHMEKADSSLRSE